MKWSAVILLCAGSAIGTVQLTNCAPQHQIKQRYVQVIEIGPDHPLMNYILIENDE